MEDWDPKIKIAILITIFVIIVGALLYGLFYLISHRSQSAVNQSNLYTNSDLNVTKVVTTGTVDYGKNY